MFMYQLSARGDDDDDYADDSDGDGGSSTPSAPLGMSAIGELRLNISKYLKEQGVKILLASISLTKDPQKLKLRSRSRSKQWTDVEVERVRAWSIRR